MKSFVKLHLSYAQRKLKNVIHIHAKWQNCKKLRLVKSSAKFTSIKLRPCLNNYKSSKTIDLVEVA